MRGSYAQSYGKFKQLREALLYTGIPKLKLHNK